MKKYFMMIATLLISAFIMIGCAQKSETGGIPTETEVNEMDSDKLEETEQVREAEVVVTEETTEELESEEDTYYIPEGVDLESSLSAEEWMESFIGVVQEPVVVIINDVTGRKEVIQREPEIMEAIQRDSIIYLDGKNDMVGIYNPEGIREVSSNIPTDYSRPAEVWTLKGFSKFEEGDYEVSECSINTSFEGEEWCLELRVYTGAAPQNIIDDLTAPTPYRVYYGNSTKEDTESAQGNIFMDEQVLIEENNVKMTASSIEMKEDGDGYLILQMENNTDEELEFVCSEVYVNDCYIGGSLYETVEAGTNKKSSIKFLENDLYKLYDAGEAAKINVYIEVVKPDDTRIVSGQWVTIDTNKKAEYKGNYDDSGEVLYESNGIKILYKGINEDNTAAILCAENHNYGNVYIHIDNIVINGYELNYTFFNFKETEQKQIRFIYFKDKDSNEVEIGEIEEGTMLMHIWAGESVDKEYVFETMEELTF